MWRDVPFVRQRRPIIGVSTPLRLYAPLPARLHRLQPMHLPTDPPPPPRAKSALRPRPACGRGCAGAGGGRSEGGLGWDPPSSQGPPTGSGRRAEDFEPSILLAPKAPKQKVGCQPQTSEGEVGGGPGGGGPGGGDLWCTAVLIHPSGGGGGRTP